MDQKQQESTEARFALTIVICISVAVGYLALHRLGGTGEVQPIEPRPPVAQQPIIPDDQRRAEEDPQVLPIDPQSPIQMSRVPERPAPNHGDDAQSGTDNPGPPTRSELR